MKQLFTTFLLLAATAFAGMAQNGNDVYKYSVEADVDFAECIGGMMGDLSNDFNPGISREIENETIVCFNLLSLDDYKPHPTAKANIKITFDNGKTIRFVSTRRPLEEGSVRMFIKMRNATAEQLSLLATHDITEWEMDGHAIDILSPTAGIFATMLKALEVKDIAGRPVSTCDAEPVNPICGRYHMCMAVRPTGASTDAHLMFLNADQWRRLKNKDNYEKTGLLVHYDNNKCFLVDYYDQYDNCGYPDWFTAVEKYGDRLPTALMGALLSQTTEIRDVANAFGGDNYGNYYWTSSVCDDSDGSEAYVFCPGIPDAPIDRQNMAEPTNAGVLLVDTGLEDIYDYYLDYTLE